MICTNCSKEVPDGSAECPFCHHALSGNEGTGSVNLDSPESLESEWGNEGVRIQVAGCLLFGIDILIAIILLVNYPSIMSFILALLIALFGLCSLFITIGFGVIVSNSNKQTAVMQKILKRVEKG